MPNKKEQLSVIIIKILLAVVIFAGVGTVIISVLITKNKLTELDVNQQQPFIAKQPAIKKEMKDKDIINLFPLGAQIIEIKTLESELKLNRALVLWMTNSEKHPKTDDTYTCPEITRGSFYRGPTRISLVDVNKLKVINTIKIKNPYGGEFEDSFDIPYEIARNVGPYHINNNSKGEKGRPVIMKLKDYNGDGKSLEFALFESPACIPPLSTLIGYSEKQDKVVQYPIEFTIKENNSVKSKIDYWMSNLFSSEQKLSGLREYELDSRGRAGCLSRYRISYNSQNEIFEGEIINEDCSNDVSQNETSNWKTYRNKEYGFEFKYPGDWQEWHKYDEFQKIHPSVLNRGIVYYFDNSSFKISLEKNDFKFNNKYSLYNFSFDDIPIIFGNLGDINSYCNKIKDNFSKLLNCKIIELDNKNGILRDDVFCIGSPTGGDITCSFYRILLVSTENNDFPTLIISMPLGNYNYYEVCEVFSKECLNDSKKQFNESIKKNQNRIKYFDKILSSFKFTEKNEQFFSCGDSTVKDIDGNIYNTVKIGEQCWMKENLKVTKNPEGKTIIRYCYDNDPKICDTDGGLYDWNTAMNNSITEGAQGICPDKWHVPEDSEWYVLENYLKNNGQTCSSSREGWSCEFAGTKLKSGGSSGFDGILAGYRYASDLHTDGLFYNRDRIGNFWSSTWSFLRNDYYPWYRHLRSEVTAFGRYIGIKEYAYSVRCIKD